MRGSAEANEVKEIHEGKEKSGGVAAFFDLDGTLLLQPSLERRFFRMLRYRGEIGVGNYLLWLREALWLMPRGIRVMLQANKIYLRGVQSFDGRGGNVGDDPAHDSRQQPGGHGVVSQRRDPRIPMTAFFAEGVEQVAWHAKEGHAIVLVSGTLEPLAQSAARGLESELAEHGLTARIRVCATRLVEKDGKWTGKIMGEAMFGEAKVRAVRRLAGEMQLDLGQCFAYGDSVADKCFLMAVGRAFVVNPSRGLRRIARRLSWRVLGWGGGKNPTEGTENAEVAERDRSLIRGGYDARNEQVSLCERREPAMKAGASGATTSRGRG